MSKCDWVKTETVAGELSGNIKQAGDGRVRLEVNRKDLHAGGREVLWNLAIIKALKSKGVPVYGIISIQGVNGGRLNFWRDDMFDTYIYEWEPLDYKADPAAGL